MQMPPVPLFTAAVLAVAGDDHGAKSSTLPHQSEQMFAAAMMPVLNPAGVAGLSRFRHSRLGDVALFRLLDRAEGDGRYGRKARPR